MKKMITILKVHLQSWRNNYIVWAGLGIGLGLCMMYVSRFTSYCNAIGTPCHIFEPYIVMGNMSKHSFTGIFLGCIVVLSETPFINKQSAYEILRVGTRTWVRSQILYIVVATFLYNICILLMCMGLGLVKSNVSFDNEWSSAITLLAVRQPTFAVSTFKLDFPYPDFIYAVKPYYGAILTLLFNSTYCIAVVLLMFIANIWTKVNVGWMVAAAFHIFGYVVSNNGGIFFAFNISVLECALPAALFSDTSPIGLFWAIWILAMLVMVMTEISQSSHRRLVI